MKKSAVPAAGMVVAPGGLGVSPGPQVVVPLNWPVTAKLPSLNDATAVPAVLAVPLACFAKSSPLTVVPSEAKIPPAVTESVAVTVCGPAVLRVTLNVCAPLSAPTNVYGLGGAKAEAAVSEDVKETVPPYPV